MKYITTLVVFACISVPVFGDCGYEFLAQPFIDWWYGEEVEENSQVRLKPLGPSSALWKVKELMDDLMDDVDSESPEFKKELNVILTERSDNIHRAMAAQKEVEE